MGGPRLFFIVRLAVVSVGLSLAACLIAEPVKAQAVVSEDGLVADLRVSGDRALVRWRFLKPLTSALNEISGNLDGAPLGTPRVTSYPDYGEVTRVLVLIDPTGADRRASVNKQIAAAVGLSEIVPRHVEIAYGVYSSETRILLPHDINDLVVTLASINAADEHPDLLSALTSGIRMLSALRAERRALFIFTDGHSEVAIKNETRPNCADCASTVADFALRNGVSVNFILASSSRSKELEALRLIASRSGGQVVEEADTLAFIAHPLTIVDSGGSVVFPIPQHLVYFWQSEPKLNITFDMGDRKLQLSSFAPQPKPTLRETFSYIWRNHRSYAIFGALLLIGAGAAPIGFLIGWRRRPADNERSDVVEGETGRQIVYAVLQNIDNGKSTPVTVDRINIGRANSNDIVIEDEAVSREHAVLLRQESGSFVIENKGSNGTSVNHLPIEQAELADGDLITMGDTTLRFVQTKA
jgi:hypothetical protein